MDTGRGNFEPISDEVERDLRKEMKDSTRDLPRIFKVGQVYKVNGSRFRVAKVAKRRLILKLLADHESDDPSARSRETGK